MDVTKDPKGFFAALFDFSFSQFITTKLIKLLFILGLIFIAFGYLTMVIGGFAQGFATGLFLLLIGGPFVVLIQIIVLRVWLELVIVLFRIVEHTGILAGKATGGGPPPSTPPPPSEPPPGV